MVIEESPSYHDKPYKRVYLCEKKSFNNWKLIIEENQFKKFLSSENAK